MVQVSGPELLAMVFVTWTLGAASMYAFLQAYRLTRETAERKRRAAAIRAADAIPVYSTELGLPDRAGGWLPDDEYEARKMGIQL